MPPEHAYRAAYSIGYHPDGDGQAGNACNGVMRFQFKRLAGVRYISFEEAVVTAQDRKQWRSFVLALRGAQEIGEPVVNDLVTILAENSQNACQYQSLHLLSSKLTAN